MIRVICQCRRAVQSYGYSGWRTAIDLNKTYTVASHNYMLKSGGDGMTMFNGCNIIKDEVMVDVDVLSTYIQGLGGSVSLNMRIPRQGRIVIR